MRSAQTTFLELSTEKSEVLERWFKRLRPATVRLSRAREYRHIDESKRYPEA